MYKATVYCLRTLPYRDHRRAAARGVGGLRHRRGRAGGAIYDCRCRDCVGNPVPSLTLVAIRNPSEWTRVWHIHAVGLRGKEGVEPTIDFTQEMVIAVFAGEVGLDTRVSIIKIVQDKQRLQVLYRIANP